MAPARARQPRSGGSSHARRRHARYVRAAVGERLEPPWAEAFEGLVIGSSDFLEQLRARAGVEQPDPERKGAGAMATRPSVGAIAREATEALGVDPEAWAEGTRHDAAARRRDLCPAARALLLTR